MNAEKLRNLNHKKNEDRYFNRELSWLAFNQRVLAESMRERTPLLERCKFLAITYANLDEFFMVRVAGKKRELKQGIVPGENPDSMPLTESLSKIAEAANALTQEMGEVWRGQLLPRLQEAGIPFQQYLQLDESSQHKLRQHYRDQILPVLTPLAVDPAHPFPFLANRRLYLLIRFQENEQGEPPIAFVEVPHVLPRLLHCEPITGSPGFLWLEELIAQYVQGMFFGHLVAEVYSIRVTRNLDYKLSEAQVVDLLSSIQTEVKARDQAEAVRLEYSQGLPEFLLDKLLTHLHLLRQDAYVITSPLALADLSSLLELPREDLKFPIFNPRLPARMSEAKNIFTLIREEDLLLHHPFDSFYAVIEFLHSAAWDPDVLAIKQTLYRTSGDSPIIDALILAAEHGKQVTAVVELKARFDENNNITWARRMERAGVHVVYGSVGLKTHCKMTLIVRKEGQRLQRYVHLSTGNYNSSTARHYVDLGLLTASTRFGEDASLLFNMLTGFNVLAPDVASLLQSPFHKLLVAPLFLRKSILAWIEREIISHQATGDGLIFAKMNSLVDRAIIDKLYEASQAGVRIRLVVRGICCLRPQHPGLSENIEVISLVGRFLEHSRIFYFRNQGREEIYLGSADWMPRNMDRRVEILFPIEDDKLKKRLMDEIIPHYWSDTENAWSLQSDGSYRSCAELGKVPLDAHRRFIELARELGIKSLPYEKAIRHDLKRKGRPIEKRAKVRKTPGNEG